MSKAITFEINSGTQTCTIHEKGTTRDVATYDIHNKSRADKHCAYLTAEHGNGRVAQGHCTKGHACDRDRIHCDPRDFGLHAFVVLCADHAAEFAPGARWSARRRR